MENKSKVLVWDLPTRVFHWVLVISFLTAYFTSEGEHLRSIHVLAGYNVALMIIFRLIWGLVGTRYARFTQFIRSPLAAIRYFKAIKNGDPEHHVGHNPAGALAILALLAFGIATPLTGWLTFSDTMDAGEIHELLGNAFMGLVVIHVIAVVLSSVLHKENLARAMVTGKKEGASTEGIRSARPLVGALLLALVVGFVYSGYGGAKSLLAQQPMFAPLFQDNRLEAGDDYSSADSSEPAKQLVLASAGETKHHDDGDEDEHRENEHHDKESGEKD
ncbi:cytochrome b/b6 domain-containing protein [Leeia sp. TBRC 13508]|uniref:Cytochrome b/b6 domain-containing protein n=1 Tax=Leeia speluncae TaxID=2884804 RepID=A0ABS8D559_9NEIS|nr:cytochrome b/b6 domain-containing protein [Leeia speluncae]MCB6183306.1 cytochrome b/b6 domain-containing protein [Leeia speluncae]